MTSSGTLRGCLAVKFNFCNNLPSSVHTLLVNILWYVRLYITLNENIIIIIIIIIITTTITIIINIIITINKNIVFIIMVIIIKIMALYKHNYLNMIYIIDVKKLIPRIKTLEMCSL